jgi:ribosome-binding protein aMBF1 (putative translation factor)
MGDDGEYSHQDWKPVVLRNTALAKKMELQRGGESTKKTQTSGPVAGQKNIDDDDFVAKKFDKTFGKIVSSKRNQKGMSQEAFAKKLCLQKSLIQNVENGTAVYNPSLMSKLRKELNI